MKGAWKTAWKGGRLPRAVARMRLKGLKARGETGIGAPADEAWSLRGVALLDALPDEVAEALARRARRRELERRQEVPLEEGRHLFVVEQGGGKLCSVSEDGRKLALGLIEAGDLFGRVTVGGPSEDRQVILEPLEPTCVLELPRDLVEDALRDRPELALAVVQQLEDGQRRLTRRLEALIFKDLRTRVAETLLELSGEIGHGCAHGFAVDVRLSQQDLAELVGATRQHVNRVIGELSKGMYVQRIGRVLCILDRERLADLVGQ